ncbi:MAG: hypothetical protein ABIF19_04615 [Planctomycetota bacterium]
MRRNRVMTNRISMLITGLSLALATVAFSGCTTGNAKYSKETPVLLERVPEENASISDVHAYEDGDTLVIYGKVKRSSDNCCDAARGHVDMALVAGDGTILDLISVPYSPRNIPKARTRSSHFTARLPYTLPEDVRLRLRYHQSEDAAAIAKGTETLMCKQNVAATQSEI